MVKTKTYAMNDQSQFVLEAHWTVLFHALQFMGEQGLIRAEKGEKENKDAEIWCPSRNYLQGRKISELFPLLVIWDLNTGCCSSATSAI